MRGPFTGQGDISDAIDTGIGDGGGMIRVVLNVNLDTRKVNIDWKDLNNPSNFGTYATPLDIPQSAINLGPLTSIDLFFNTTGVSGPRGFDNVKVTPEPAAAVMLVAGTLALVARRRRSVA